MVASCRGDLSFRRTARKATLSGLAIRRPGPGLGTCWAGLHLLFKEEAAKLLVIPYEGTRQIRGRVASAEHPTYAHVPSWSLSKSGALHPINFRSLFDSAPVYTRVR